MRNELRWLQEVQETTIMDGIVRTIDFALARCKHLEWKTKLISALDGRPGLTQAEAACYTDCDVGKWIQSLKLQKHENPSSMQELEQAHLEVHFIATRILQMKDTGDTAGAHQEFRKLDQVSDRLLMLIRQVEREA